MTTKEETKEIALNSFEAFVRLIDPNRVLGSIHSKLMSWMTREEAKDHQLILLPREHQKSTIAGAYYAVWEITRNPAIRILYISSMSNLATKQLKLIKDILTSDIYRFYWPEMINLNEGKREKWTETEISVDHPKRKVEFVREPTVFTAGLTTSITGLHCDLAILDDVVTKENAFTEEGREKTEFQYSLLASVESTGAREVIVGTRYHPLDLYGTLLTKKVITLDTSEEVIGEEDLYEVFQEQVETVGDGSGEYLWPRQQRKDGKWFGFNREILSTKEAQYLDKTQFRAQYYNDPNSSNEGSIPREHFQYYDRAFLRSEGDYWYFKNNRLNIFCSIDFAYTLGKKSDYTAIVVVGVDRLGNYYVLDIDRFKGDTTSTYFEHLVKLHNKWNFRQVRAEATGAQSVIIKDLKQNYIQKLGLALSIKEYNPPRYLGAKEERILSILQSRYANGQIWHYQGGNCQILEDELISRYSSHDDVKDALASCIDFCVFPTTTSSSPKAQPMLEYHYKYGGII